MDLASAIVPTYNSEATLTRARDGVSARTHPAVEGVGAYAALEHLRTCRVPRTSVPANSRDV
jgi:hypothetical protein